MVEQRGSGERSTGTPPAGEPLTVRLPPTGPVPAAPTAAPTPTPEPTLVAAPPTGPAPAVGTGPRWPLLVLAGLLLLALGGAGGWLARGAAGTTTVAATPAPAVTVTAASTSTAPPLPLAGPPIVPATSTPAGDGPALGRSQGARRGYGAVRPAEIDGGADRGPVTGITWRDWGEDRATGRGTALYRPGDQPDARGVQDRATVVAFDLGDCDGQEAYRRVTWYFPQHGESFRESRALELCD